jgi:hypothetical protein
MTAKTVLLNDRAVTREGDAPWYRDGSSSGAMCATCPSTTVFELQLLFTLRVSSCYYSNSHFVSNIFLALQYHEK